MLSDKMVSTGAWMSDLYSGKQSFKTILGEASLPGAAREVASP